MTLRFAAAFSLLLGATGVGGYMTVAGYGPLVSREARHLRAMKQRHEAPARPVPITFADLGSLPHGRPLAEYSGIEGRGVSLEGYVQSMLNSSDGDLHLVVSATESVPTWPNIASVTAELPVRHRQGAWQFERLAALFRPVGSGYHRWDRPARRVRLSGWLLYDYPFDTPETASIGRTTGWEVHPVTAIAVWDETRQRFVDVPR